MNASVAASSITRTVRLARTRMFGCDDVPVNDLQPIFSMSRSLRPIDELFTPDVGIDLGTDELGAAVSIQIRNMVHAEV